MPDETWPAPHPDGPVDATVSLPGSKSLTNRVLVLAALADGPSTITRPLVSRDTALMADALQALGATVERADEVWGDEVWKVEPLDPTADAITIDCGLAGTVMRFVPPLALLTSATVTFDGDERARVRPMGGTLDALRALGATIDDGGRGTLPFTVHGSGQVPGGVVEIDATASSQFVSALLLVGARFDHGLDLRHVGGALPSQPHIDMTVTELRRRGVDVVDHGGRWTVPPSGITAIDASVEPDLSNAGAFVAAALVTGGRVRVRHWPTETDQAGDRWRDLVPAFGGTADRDGDDLVVQGPSALSGVHLDLGDVGELTPVVAAVAALATSPSTLTGIAHLRGHETDRLAALATEINALGGRVTELDDGLRLEPAPLRGGSFATYHDHRMAHAGAVLGLAVPGVGIEDIGTTAKTYPGFADDWSRAVS